MITERFLATVPIPDITDGTFTRLRVFTDRGGLQQFTFRHEPSGLLLDRIELELHLSWQWRTDDGQEANAPGNLPGSARMSRLNRWNTQWRYGHARLWRPVTHETVEFAGGLMGAIGMFAAALIWAPTLEEAEAAAPGARRNRRTPTLSPGNPPLWNLIVDDHDTFEAGQLFV